MRCTAVDGWAVTFATGFYNAICRAGHSAPCSRRRVNTVVVGEDAVLVEYVGSAQLDVLYGHCSAGATAAAAGGGGGSANTRQSVLDVVQQALGHEWVLVQVHQVSRLHQTHTRTHTHTHTQTRRDRNSRADSTELHILCW